MRRRLPRHALGRRLALVVAALLTAGAAHSRMDTHSRTPEDGERLLPRPEQARVSTLGFDALVSDIYWLEAIQLVGGLSGAIGEHAPRVARLIELVTTLDPWVGHPYRFAAVWLSDDVESVQRANALLERAISYHPDDWRNYHYLGFNHFFQLGDNERAAEAIESAIGLPGAPAYLGGLAAKLRLDEAGLETAAAFLQQLADSTQDEYARAEYQKTLDEIQTERWARLLDGARAAYRERFGRDIEKVRDLVRGPRPVLRALPPAHPHFDSFRWELSAKSGEIVSSFYDDRYRLHVHPLDREHIERRRRERQAQARAG